MANGCVPLMDLQGLRSYSAQVYAQWHFISEQGRDCLTAEEAAAAGPDLANKDLFQVCLARFANKIN